eukprot:764569-Hanusia_phi.AAC.8
MPGSKHTRRMSFQPNSLVEILEMCRKDYKNCRFRSHFNPSKPMMVPMDQVASRRLKGAVNTFAALLRMSRPLSSFPDEVERVGGLEG